MNNVGVTAENVSIPEPTQWDVPTDEMEEFLRWLNRPVPEILYVAVKAFRRDLPELLRNHDRELVAYHGEHRIGISPEARPLLDLCESLGLNRREVLIVGIHPSTYADTEIQVS